SGRQPAALRRQDTGRTGLAIARPGTPFRSAAELFRRVGAGARGAWSVRRAGSFRRAAYEGDWRSDGARRRGAPRAATGHRAGDAAGLCGRCGWSDPGVLADEMAVGLAIRCGRHRSVDLWRDRFVADRRGAAGLLDTGETGDEGRSDDRASMRIGSRFQVPGVRKRMTPQTPT